MPPPIIIALFIIDPISAVQNVLVGPVCKVTDKIIDTWVVFNLNNLNLK